MTRALLLVALLCATAWGQTDRDTMPFPNPWDDSTNAWRAWRPDSCCTIAKNTFKHNIFKLPVDTEPMVFLPCSLTVYFYDCSGRRYPDYTPAELLDALHAWRHLTGEWPKSRRVMFWFGIDGNPDPVEMEFENTCTDTACQWWEVERKTNGL